MKVKAINKLIEDSLNLALLKLPQEDRLNVEIPKTINKYSSNHPKGSLLIAYAGSIYQKQADPNNVVSDRDRNIKIFIVCKNFNEGMQAADYVDFVLDAIAGLEVTNKSARKKIYPIKDEFLDEDDKNFWWYSVEFGIPDRFFELKFREK